MSKTCYIVGAGECEAYPAWKKQEGDIWIAADGGYAALKQQGIEPDVVVGDFDSLDEIPEHLPVVYHPPEKDETDLYLAYQEGKKRGCDTFWLLGAFGGRPDHTYANQQMLLRMRRDGSMGYLQAGAWCMTVIEREALVFETPQKRGYVSVFCLEGRAEGVSETGLKYGLQDVTLYESVPLGVSNEFTGEEAMITVKQGALLVMWEHQNRPMPRRVKVEASNETR